MGELHCLMRGEYIALSFGISFVGAYCGINTCEQFRLSSKEKSKLLSRRVLKLLMAISIGGVAIWSMHFVGMSSISFEDEDGGRVHVRYRTDLTLISLAIVTILCYAGIHICSKDAAFTIDRVDTIDEFVRGAALMSITEIKNMHSANYVLFLALFKDIQRLVLGGFVTAIGVCVMHYIGMTAIVTDARLEYDAGIVAASILIAVLASIAGYWILFRLLALYPHVEVLRLISSFIFALAVNGMHYTGMAATKFIYIPSYSSTIPITQTVSSEAAVTGAIIASMIFILMILLITIADLRAWFYMKSRTVRAADAIIESFTRADISSAGLREAVHKYRVMRGGRSRTKSFLTYHNEHMNTQHCGWKKGLIPSMDLSSDSRHQKPRSKGGSKYKINSVVVDVSGSDLGDPQRSPDICNEDCVYPDGAEKV